MRVPPNVELLAGFTKPLSSHENQPLSGPPWWLQVTLGRIPAEKGTVLLLGEHVPQPGRSPQQMMPHPAEGLLGVQMPP